MTTPPNHNTADQSGADELSDTEILMICDHYGMPAIATADNPQSLLAAVRDIIARSASTQPAPQEPIAMIDPERIDTLYGPIGACAVHATLYQAGMNYNDKATMALYATPQPFPAPAVQPTSSASSADDSSGIFSDMNACMFRDKCRAAIVPQVVQAPKKLAELIATLSLRVAEQTCCKSDVDLVKEADAALKSLAAPIVATPKLTECRHCGFMVALNQAPADAAPIVATVPSEQQIDELPPADPSIVPINSILDLINKAITCGNKPMPDPIAHSHEAYARALHNVFCDMRFKLFEVRSILLDCAAPSPTEQASDVRNAALTVDIEQMVNRFLSWKLPQTFAPDCGILFKQVYADSWPTGTNLFHAGEAKAMFQHCLDTAAAKGNAQDEAKS